MRLLFVSLMLLANLASAQPETHRYAIEIAGARVGTMTATRQTQGATTQYTIISDVLVNLLVYKVKIYYKTVCQYQGNKLLSAVVEAKTNRGDFASSTVWNGDHYDIKANQYKYERQARQTAPIDYSVANLYFSEPVGRNRVFAEYFGDYFLMSKTPKGTYRAQFDDREDEYIYEGGRLTRIIKKNAIKNFVIRLLE
ncbi:DUF6134 family protein [Rudanella lutea]|uniref:DUF6134 family protein n=1 Tax=Rudanella lutea TaxID=451374 RepID=UPI000486CA75|nr:DUF6134 family protein [Rudanella lutea]